jgi:prepilin-type N-terminal cleavage/methylation domain-containing protein
MTLPSRRKADFGYTLLELLIVVALLGIAMSFALPSLGRFSQRGHLLDAARQLRAELLGARLAAIESGNPAWFSFQPGSGSYNVTTTDRAAGRDQLAGNPLIGASGDLLADQGAMFADQEPQALPAGVVFLNALDGARPAAASDSGAARGDWSTPLIFYPNGRALNSRILLALDHYRVELTVRGLTGTVQISPIQRTTASRDDAAAAERTP